MSWHNAHITKKGRICLQFETKPVFLHYQHNSLLNSYCII